MQNIFTFLLTHRKLLGRLTILISIIPFLVNQISLLQLPLLIAGLSLFVTVNFNRIKSIISSFINSHYWLKIQYFWFTIGFIVISILVYSFFKNFIPYYFFTPILYVLVYIIWFNKVNSYITENSEKIVFKSHTKEEKRFLDFELYLIPITFTLIVVFVITSLQALIITQGRSIFSIELIYWSFTFVVLIIHFLIDLMFNEQLIWEPSDGSVEWKNIEIPKLPDSKNPVELANYFNIVKRVEFPPDGIFELLEDHLSFLVENAQNIDFLAFQRNFVISMGNWGQKAKNYIHIMLVIILASVSKFRILGLIPIYRRSIFYTALQVIAQSGSMTTNWRELFEYEVLKQEDPDHILDWVVGESYHKEKYKPTWVISWGGRVYKGRSGYYMATEKMEKQIHIRPQFSAWALDIWNIVLEYSRIYIGETSREILSEDASRYNKLCYLSQHKTVEEYDIFVLSKKDSLQKPVNRLVMKPEEAIKAEISEEEKNEIIASYLADEPRELEKISIKSSIMDLLHSSSENTIRLNLTSFFLILLVVIIFGLNLYLILFLSSFTSLVSPILLIGIESIILFLVSIYPSNADLKLSDSSRTHGIAIKNKVLSSRALKINNPDVKYNSFFIIYAFSLLFSFQIFFR